MAQVNADFQGRVFNGTPPYLVSEAKITEFADAVAATGPAHRDTGAASELGHHGLVAPVTFPVIIAQRAEAEYITDEAAGIDFSRVVHANQAFRYTRPVVAGDRLHTVVHVQDITERRGITMVTTRTEITDDDGAPVVEVTSTLAVRGDGDGAP